MERPLKEVTYRLSQPGLFASAALRQIERLYDAISPTEFSTFYRRVRRFTMCSNARLRGLYRAVNHVISEGVPGDIVECGTARGGSAALMGLVLQKNQASDRRLWVFDTFEGLPAPTEKDADFEIANLYTGTCVGTLEDVTTTFRDLRVEAEFVKGLFQETLPVARVREVAVLHIDGDWYESVKTCLENLYDKVAEGGIVQIDDYGFWKGAQLAVDEFIASRGLDVELKRIDYAGRQILKKR